MSTADVTFDKGDTEADHWTGLILMRLLEIRDTAIEAFLCNVPGSTREMANAIYRTTDHYQMTNALGAIGHAVDQNGSIGRREALQAIKKAIHA